MHLFTYEVDVNYICIYIYISQRKGNQTMKIRQLIEYNKRNIFLEKIMQKMRQGE